MFFHKSGFDNVASNFKPQWVLFSSIIQIKFLDPMNYIGCSKHFLELLWKLLKGKTRLVAKHVFFFFSNVDNKFGMSL